MRAFVSVCGHAACVLSSTRVCTHQPSVALLWQGGCWFGPAWVRDGLMGAQPLEGEGPLPAVTWLVASLLARTLPIRRMMMIPNLSRHLLRVIVPRFVLSRHRLAICCQALPCCLRLQAICLGALASVSTPPEGASPHCALQVATGWHVCKPRLTAGCVC